MKLRTRVAFAELPLLAVVAALAIYAVNTIVGLSRKADMILADNYESVRAADRMMRAIEDEDSVLLRECRSDDAPVGSSAVVLGRFADALYVQEHNITEPGEKEATEDLRASYERWRKMLLESEALPTRQERWDAYYDRVRPLASDLRRQVGRILDINEYAMTSKATATSRFSKEVVQTMSYVGLAALVLVVLVGLVLSDQIARPLGRLAESARQIGEGNLDVKLDEPRPGDGEVDTLLREFSRMTEKLKAYRRSSLGELIEASEAAQAAIDSLIDPVLGFNADGSLGRANEAARRILGFDPDSRDPLGVLPAEVRVAIVRVRDDILQGKGTHRARGFENAIAVLVDGRPHYFQPVGTPIQGERTGTVIGVTVLLRDVTTLRRADELKTDLLSTVAHEIRTPLTSIRMAIHLCLEGTIGPLTAKQEEILTAAREDAERLHKIVEGILSVSKIEAGALVVRRHPASARELIERAVAPFRVSASDKGVALEAAGPDAPVLEVDADSIVLVLANMLSNALTHTPEGGKIRVFATPEEESVHFEVSDTGSGIPPEHQPRLFEKFYRVPGSPPGGTGLGLSIARDIVFAHDGEIGIESAVGKGSRFWFRLPAAKR